MLPLNVNILIKQAPWPASYPEQIKNIEEMRELHKNNPRVIQLDPKTNILDAIMVSDVLVSEESSTMCECVMMGKPAISVCNWLIPDVTPSRYPADDYDYVVKTKKEELTECVNKVLGDYKRYAKEAQTYSDTHFSNLGHCIPMMLDILDATIERGNCPYQKLPRKDKEKVSYGFLLRHHIGMAKQTIYYNYRERSKLVAMLWTAGKRIKNALQTNNK